jgi:hypothetical protein
LALTSRRGVGAGVGRAAAAGATGRSAALVGCVPPLGVVMSSSAWTISPALCGRSAGRFSRQRITSAANAGGRFGRRRDTGSTTSVTCAASSCDGFRPVNGGCPVSIS